MKLGALPPTPVVSDENTVIVDGTGVAGAIQTAANVAATSVNSGVVPGSMVQTDKGPMFQPNPTTVTVVPPARSIQVVGEPEGVVADEDLEEISTGSTIPSLLPTSGIPMAQQQAQLPQAPMQGGYMMPMFQYGQGFNMSQSPAIYASSQPQPAQLYTSGVPGVPPTIAVATDQVQMGNFLMPQNAPRPMRNNVTHRKKSVSFGGSDESEQSGGSSNPAVTINVIKGN